MTSDLEIEHLSFWYRTTAPPIIYDCCFSVAEDEFVAIVGESGSGKSTLLRLACGLIQALYREAPESGFTLQGQITYQGNPIQEPLCGFAYVPQNYHPSLLFTKTAEDNILFSVRERGIDEAERQRAETLMRTTNIYGVRRLRAKDLSGGQQQRVAICRALLKKPTVLFMDEPFANLDPMLKPGISDLLKELRSSERLSVLLVTHDIANAVAFANKLVSIRGGYSVPEYRCWNVDAGTTRTLVDELTRWIEYDRCTPKRLSFGNTPASF